MNLLRKANFRILRIVEAAAYKRFSDVPSLNPISTHSSYHPHTVNGTSLSRAGLDVQGYTRLIPRLFEILRRIQKRNCL